MRTAAAATIIVLLGNNIMLGRFPVWVGLLYIIGGIASWLFYEADKRAAERREWRAPERRLHLADLSFGIIGGLLAQHVLRHKTYKPGFVMVTALITALHVLTLGLIMVAVYVPGGVGDFFRAAFRADPLDRRAPARRLPRQRQPRNSRELAHALSGTNRTPPRLYNFFRVFLITSVPTPAYPEQILRA